MTGRSQLGKDPGGALQPHTKNHGREKPPCEMLVGGGNRGYEDIVEGSGQRTQIKAILLSR